MEKLSKDSTNVLEYRRLRAVELHLDGMKAIEIAKALGVTRGAVSQWLKKYREGGIEALLYKKIVRKPCRLSAEQLAFLVELLKRGAEEFGCPGQIWTRARIAELIMKYFNVQYHVTQVGRILKKTGWTWQKPVKLAIQRNEESVRLWRENRWPEIKKKRLKKEEQ